MVKTIARFCALAAVMFVAACTQPVVSQQEAVPQGGDGTASSLCGSFPEYDTYFTGERLRLDLVLAGDKDSQSAYLSELHKEKHWSGNPDRLIDKFGYGQYFLEAFAGDTLVFSKGFSTLFEEWRTTEQAKSTPMAANQTVWMPFPKRPVRIVLYQRLRTDGRFEPMLEFDVDPEDRHIVPGAERNYHISALQYKGDPAHKVDIVICGEAYTGEMMQKFRIDAIKMMNYFWTMEPYASRRDDFNVWLVESSSNSSSVDIPQDGIWKDTVLGSMFDTFYEDRYLTVWDHRKIAAVVSGAEFDTIIVIANENKYGGGGIYGSFAMGSSDNERSLPVHIHEFGHSFAGLGDEYFESSTAYQDFYPAGIEPWEPNITTQTNFDSKWADMMGQDGVGLFEGAGYQAKGCWRPVEECRMFNNTAPGFCPVCQRAINRMIDFYTEK